MISREEIEEQINRGKLGLNKGIPYGYNRLTEFIPNIQQSTYYLVGGELSTGKSAFANDMFVYNVIDWYIDNIHKTDVKLIIPYYSFEIPKRDMAIKFLARYIYKRYGILLDINYILSRGNYRISEEYYNLVKKHLDVFDKLDDILIVQDLPKNPTGIWYDMLKLANMVGKGLKNNNGVLEFDDNTPYKLNSPNQFVLPIIDHIGLSKKEREFSKKEVIDKLSEYMIILRNKCGFSPVMVQQLNRNLSSADRFKLDRVEPQLSDFKESGNTQEDANVVLALFSPQRYEIGKFRDYNITRLRDRFRSVHILKNRDGEANKVLGMEFIGEVGLFRELPKASEMTEEDYIRIELIKKSI